MQPGAGEALNLVVEPFDDLRHRPCIGAGASTSSRAIKYSPNDFIGARLVAKANPDRHFGQHFARNCLIYEPHPATENPWVG